jgi:flavin reductase (DIM6/NTAB) family NADH-FMN oxidoreductase RutF
MEIMKIKIGTEPYLYPIPIVLVGAMVNGKANFETIGDVGIMGLEPALVYISSHRDHYTNIGITREGAFSINIPTTAMLAETDYCGIVSGVQSNKADLFEIFFGNTGAPMIEECPVNLECKVLRELTIQHRQVFIADIVQTYASSGFVEKRNGKQIVCGLDKLDPIVYALDNRYYRIGGTIGVGYKEGLQISRNRNDK